MYDGHGGHEVAAYCADHLPDFLKNTEAYQKGDFEKALIDAYLGFDLLLTKPDVVKVLHTIAGKFFYLFYFFPYLIKKTLQAAKDRQSHLKKILMKCLTYMKKLQCPSKN